MVSTGYGGRLGDKCLAGMGWVESCGRCLAGKAFTTEKGHRRVARTAGGSWPFRCPLWVAEGPCSTQPFFVRFIFLLGVLFDFYFNFSGFYIFQLIITYKLDNFIVLLAYCLIDYHCGFLVAEGTNLTVSH